MEDYTISGATAAELRASLGRVGTVLADGRRYDGHTRHRIDWESQYWLAPGGCRLSRVVVRAEIHYVLPRWTPLSWATPGLDRRWVAYLQALKTHEERHGTIVKEAAARLRDALDALPLRPTCAEVGQEAEHLGRRATEEMESRQRSYDGSTRHGQTEGVRLW